jgi:hypothetical protein
MAIAPGDVGLPGTGRKYFSYLNHDPSTAKTVSEMQKELSFSFAYQRRLPFTFAALNLDHCIQKNGLRCHQNLTEAIRKNERCNPKT